MLKYATIFAFLVMAVGFGLAAKGVYDVFYPKAPEIKVSLQEMIGKIEKRKENRTLGLKEDIQ